MLLLHHTIDNNLFLFFCLILYFVVNFSFSGFPSPGSGSPQSWLATGWLVQKVFSPPISSLFPHLSLLSYKVHNVKPKILDWLMVFEKECWVNVFFGFNFWTLYIRGFFMLSIFVQLIFAEWHIGQRPSSESWLGDSVSVTQMGHRRGTITCYQCSKERVLLLLA